MKKLMLRKDIAILSTLGWMSLIFYLSHQPASESSELSGSIVELYLKLILFLPLTIDTELVHFFIRKSAHFIAYFILGFLVIHSCRLFLHQPILAILTSFVVTVIYAISDEFHQRFIPGRSGEVRDVFIDSAGSFTGIFTYVLIVLLYNKVRNRFT